MTKMWLVFFNQIPTEKKKHKNISLTRMNSSMGVEIVHPLIGNLRWDFDYIL